MPDAIPDAIPDPGHTDPGQSARREPKFGIGFATFLIQPRRNTRPRFLFGGAIPPFHAEIAISDIAVPEETLMPTTTTAPAGGNTLLKIILAILLPPLAVFMHSGLGTQFWLNLVLTIVGLWIVGIIHALIVVL